MPCRQVAEYNGRPGGQKFLHNAGGVFVYAPYQTEAECLGYCKEGACCDGVTCSVKPQCQCQGAGKVFKGVGTVCTETTCLCGYGTCCGPSTFTNVLGQTRRTCQQLGNKASCDAIGGEWAECGVCAQCGDTKNPGPCGCELANPLP